jgi:hypothetical protein
MSSNAIHKLDEQTLMQTLWIHDYVWIASNHKIKKSMKISQHNNICTD